MRVRKSLEGHEAVNWLDTVQQHEVDSSVADEIEAALDGELERTDNNGGQGAVTIKRAEPFQYGSAGSRGLGRIASPFQSQKVSSGTPLDPHAHPLQGDMRGALQRHGPSAVRHAVQSGLRNSETSAVSHARGVIRQLGNGRKK